MPALIGALRVSLSADTAAFHSGMKRAEAQARSSGTAINKSLGLIKAGFVGLASGLSIGLITRGIKAGLDYAGSLGEISQQLGVTTRDLQVFRFAAGQVGVKQEQLETGLSKLTITLGKVAAGAKAPIAALNAIGISVDQLKGKDTGEAFRIIADGLAKVTDRSQRAAVEVALFGKSGAQLDNLLAGGSKAVNELAAAADKLGIILSDEQIQKADQTADKLDALQTVLTARIAGQVADNADSILALADALVALVSAAGAAIGALTRFFAVASQPLPQLGGKSGLGSFLGFLTNPAGTVSKIGSNIGQQAVGGKRGGGSATAVIPKARLVGAPSAGVDIGKFLAGGGGGGRKGRKDNSAEEAERKRLQALRDAFQFEEEQRRADMDILRAKQQLATDYSDRATLSVQMLDLEREGFEAELQYRISAKELTTAQADQLRAKFAINDALQRQIILEDEQADRLKDYNQLEQVNFDIKRDLLDSESQLAESTSERLDIELRMIDLFYRQERARLEAVLADEKSTWAAKEEARRRLAALGKMEENDRAGAAARNRSPLQDFKAQWGDITEENEQAVVSALENMADALANVADGWKEMKKAALETLKTLVQELLSNQIKHLFASMIPAPGQGFNIGSIFSGGFATGGFTGDIGRNRIAGFVHGNEFVLNAAATSRLGVPSLEALNRGAPLSAVSNDNGTRAVIQNWNIVTPDADSFRRNQRQIGREARRGLAIQ